MANCEITPSISVTPPIPTWWTIFIYFLINCDFISKKSAHNYSPDLIAFILYVNSLSFTLLILNSCSIEILWDRMLEMGRYVIDPALSSEFNCYALNTEFIAVHVAMLHKKINPHLNYNLKTNSPFKDFEEEKILMEQLRFNLSGKCPNFGQGVRT